MMLNEYIVCYDHEIYEQLNGFSDQGYRLVNVLFLNERFHLFFTLVKP